MYGVAVGMTCMWVTAKHLNLGFNMTLPAIQTFFLLTIPSMWDSIHTNYGILYPEMKYNPYKLNKAPIVVAVLYWSPLHNGVAVCTKIINIDFPLIYN